MVCSFAFTTAPPGDPFTLSGLQRLNFFGGPVFSREEQDLVEVEEITHAEDRIVVGGGVECSGCGAGRIAAGLVCSSRRAGGRSVCCAGHLCMPLTTAAGGWLTRRP